MFAIKNNLALHFMTLTSFPRGIHSPFVGALDKNSRACSFSGRSGIQSSGLSSSTLQRGRNIRGEKVE
jgi:hypothetical protein